MNHLEACDALDEELERFAAALESAGVTALVPTCPEWTIAQLSEHLGTIHRWATRLVASRSSVRVPPDPDDVGPGPYDATWLREGGATLVATLRAARPDEPMWAWGADQHVRFWSRRQLHETLVHRLDLDIARGRTPLVDGGLAEDAIDEFLVNLKAAERFSPKVRELRGDGAVVALTSTHGSRTWRVRLETDGFVLLDTAPRPNAALSGAADELLLVVTRRRALADSALTLEGDGALMEWWLTHSVFE